MMYMDTIKKGLEENGVNWKSIKKVLRRIRWGNIAMTLVVLFGFGYGVVSMTQDIVEAYPQWQEERKEHALSSQLAKYEQVEVVIQEGDRAWNIQKILTPSSHNVLDELYLAKEINGNLDWGNLRPGDSYVFLKEKK